MSLSPPPEPADPTEPPDDLVRSFVEHWGMMARSWGINATMGELFALLYVTGRDWTAEDLRERLRVSRGNVSMNLRELLTWGVIHKLHRPGERREYYRAETDVRVLFRRILQERKRRELDPTLDLLHRMLTSIRETPGLEDVRARVASLHQFFRWIEILADRWALLEPDEFEALVRLLLPGPDDLAPPSPPTV